jgi:hypothetical protein
MAYVVTGVDIFVVKNVKPQVEDSKLGWREKGYS